MLRALRPDRGTLRGDAMLLTAAVIFGVNISVIYLMLRNFDPIALSVIRTGLGALMLAALAFKIDGSMAVSRRDVPLLLAAGLLMLLDQVSFSYSLTIVNSATLSLLFATTPLFVMLMTAAGRGRALSWRHWLAAGTGFFGVALIVTYGQRFSSHNLLGDLEGLAASVGTAAYTLMLRPLAGRYSAAKVLTYVFGISALGGAAGGLDQLADQRWGSVPWSGWILFVASVAGSIVIANAFYIIGLRRVGPIRASMYTYLEPVFGVIAAAVLLAVRLSLIEIGGGILVICALLLEPSRSGAAEPT